MKARSNTRLAVAALLIALVAMSVVLPAAAQAPRPMKFAGNNSEGRGAPTAEQIEQITADSVRRPGGLIQVIVTLASPPAVEQYIAAGGRESRASALQAAASYESALVAEQTSFANVAASVGATVVNTHTFLTNTVTMTVHPDQIAALWNMAGVVNISPDRIYDRADTTSVPLIRAQEVWDGAPGATGAGVKIGIIDTGVDYTHSHFGGPGDYSAAADTTVVGDGTAGLFPAVAPVAAGDPKVIGGYDFVGNDYDARDPLSVPAPDPDPVDCPEADGGGHGSHVAGSAAGWGVNADGTTYAGPLNPAIFASAPNVTLAFRIGPGVAPEASLVAIRIFGCNGSVNADVLLDAIESAVTGDFPGTTGDVAGGLDVINMSLGSSHGGAYNDDPLVAAQEAATDAGLIIVDSAGNNGNITLASGSPGSANSVISVASSTDTTAVADSLLVRNNGTGSPVKYFAQPGAAHNANAVPFTGDIAAASPLNGCTAISGVSGKIALIQRGSCDFVVKQNNAYSAGATGVVVFNNAGDGLISMADTGILEDYDLPTYFIGQSDGEDLLAEITDAAPSFISVTFDFGDPAYGASETADQISSFSSRGGIVRSVGDVTLKPNVAAPGNTIVSARAGTGNAFFVISGTSMASPHVAGVAALMRELHPTYTVAQIKALIMNTANADVADATIHPPQRVGSGRVDVADAAASDVIAYWTENPENVSVSFGYPKVMPGAPVVFTETITIQNLGTTARTFAAAYEMLSDMAGVTVTVDPAANLAASGTTTITVTLTVDPSVVEPNTIGYDFDTAATDTTFLTEEAGIVVLTAAGLPELRVPVYAAPHVAADMTASGLSYNTTFPETFSIDLNGTGINTNGAGGIGLSIVSQASALELVATDPDEAPVGFIPRPGDNYLQENNEAADIAAVGITTDYLATAGSGFESIYFGIAAHGEWTTPKEVLFVFYIDADRDGVEDYLVYNSPSVTNAYDSAFVDINNYLDQGADTAFTDWHLNDWHGAQLDTMLFKNNVVLVPFTYGLWNDHPQLDALPVEKQIHGAFDFWVESYNRDSDFELLIDTVGSASAPFTFDPTDPTYYFLDATGQVSAPLSLYGAPLWYSLDGNGIPVDIVKSFGAGETRPDLLVLHHHNQFAADRYQVLDTEALEPVEDSFELLTPANNAVIIDPADLTTVTWEDRTNVTITEWRFVLTHISTNTRLGQVVDMSGLTSAADADALTCAAGVCTLDVSGLPALEDGTYAWTATYTDLLGNEIEASNAPFYFALETNDINLLANPGFEDCTAGNPANWGGAAKCKNKPAKAHSGNAYLLSNAGTFAVQKVRASDNGAVDSLIAGDTLNFGGYFKGGAGAKNVAVLTIRYAGGVNQKSKLKITAKTTGYELFTKAVVLNGDPVWVKVKAGSATARVFVDDLSLSTVGINGPATRAAGDLLPPPAAPDGFRGNN